MTSGNPEALIWVLIWHKKIKN